MRKVIIVGDDHHNTLGLVRSLGEKGIFPIVYLDHKVSGIVSASKYVSDVKYVASNQLADILIRNYKDENESPVILSSSDQCMSALDMRYNDLSPFFILFNAKEQGRITHFMDKDKQYDLAEKCNLDYPKSIRLTKSELQKDKCFFPCMVKPSNSLHATKADMLVARDYDELCAHLKDGLEYLVQEYIEKDYEIMLPWCSLPDGTFVTGGVIRKIRQYPYNHGCTSFSVYESLENYKEIIPFNNLLDFVRKIGYVGIFSIEMVVKNGKAFFLEINLRNDGMGYVPTKAGLNLPYIWYKSATNEKISPSFPTTPLYSMIDEVDFNHVREGRINLFSWIKQVFDTDCFLLFNKVDKAPFYQFLKWKISSKLHLA